MQKRFSDGLLMIAALPAVNSITDIGLFKTDVSDGLKGIGRPSETGLFFQTAFLPMATICRKCESIYALRLPFLRHLDFIALPIMCRRRMVSRCRYARWLNGFPVRPVAFLAVRFAGRLRCLGCAQGLGRLGYRRRCRARLRRPMGRAGRNGRARAGRR